MKRSGHTSNARSSGTTILVVESDGEVIDELVDALGLRAANVPEDNSGGMVIGAYALGKPSAPFIRFHIVDSLIALHKLELDHYDLLLCGCGLVDGSGLDALAYARGMRPELAVVFMSAEEDTAFAVEAIRAGAMDFIVATEHTLRSLPLVIEKTLAHQRTRLENRRLQQQLSRSLAELALTNQRLQDLVGQFELLARTDELTGLANRRWLNIMLENHWAHATRSDLPLGLIMIDLDGFKRINDALGHQRGDALLRLTSDVLKANIRGVDLAARYGGDEFCILLPHTEPHEAARIARRVLREFRYAMGRQPDVACMLGMSMGLAHVDLSHPINADHLLRHADQALYDAKSRGRNRLRVRRRADDARPGSAQEIPPPALAPAESTSG